MSDNRNEDLLNYHDDNRVLRDVLMSVRGSSPVSGGVLGDILEEEARDSEETSHLTEEIDFDSDIVA